MNDELCQRLFAKFIVHIILLLWLLGQYEFKFQTTAQSTNDPLVPDEEVSSLNSVAQSLGFKGQNSFFNTLCSDGTTSFYVGIICNCDFDNGTKCHIEKLLWYNKGLKGSLPQEVANLTYLQKLDLSYNEIQGSIPAALGSMTQLYDLDLSNNQLTGIIPSSLGNLQAQVIFLGIYSRRGLLNGRNIGRAAVPCKPGQAYGRCNSNRGKGQPCPSFNLDLSNNHLEGSIPDLGSIIINLTNNEGKKLEKNQSCNDFSIYLHENHLTGSIPKSLGKLNFLTILDLHNNLLTGPIPRSLGDIPLLNTLSLGENQLNGSLPRELGNLIELGYLYLQSNYFTGDLPVKFAQLTNLYSFSISGNYLSGPFPNFITNWTSIDDLSFYGNNFWGNIPPGIFNLTSLDSLMISDVGTSPFQFPESASISYINTLVLRNCSITGPIPPYIGTNMTSLKYLDLSFNNLTGEIPRELENLNLTYMSFANNSLVGPIPAWISRAANWTQIDLSYNKFSDAKNLFLGPRSTLQQRNSNMNLFSCCPSCLSSNCTPEMIGVDQLRDIYCPPDDGKPKYHSLHINCGGEEIELGKNSYDQDNSTLPYGVSRNGTNYWAFSSTGSFLSASSNSSDFIKNAKCGIPVADAPLYSKARLAPVSLKYYGFCLRNGSYNVSLHFADIVYTGEDAEHSNLKKRIFDVYIQNKMVRRNFHINSTVNETGKVAVIENTTKVENGILEIHLYWAGKGSSGNPPDFNGPLLSAVAVTPDFDLGGKLSRSHIAMITLGSITFALLLLLTFSWMMGWLEKEELHDIKVGDDKTVTLKQLIAATRGFNKEMEIGKGGFGTVYRAELPDQRIVAVKKLSTLSDEGIEKLNVGIYHLRNLRHDNLVRLLDIHVGKDLCFLVYEYMENKSLSNALFEHKIKLNWDARFNICLGIARGLEYLHEHPRWKMVHWGIKAANILLDGKLKPKISDLGLASASVENANVANYFLSMMGTEESTGYMAPEYPAIGKKSGYKYDIYSFGVVMLEIVCGRKNVGASLKNKEEFELLVDEVCVADSRGKLLSLVDESLCGTYDTKQAMTILKLAMKCTHISPGVRPTMSQVVSVLADDKSLDEISVPASKEDEKTMESSEDLAKDADQFSATASV